MENIKQMRENLNMNRTTFALKVGVSLTTCQNWESGVVKPKPEHLKRIKEVLGVQE